MDKTQWQDPVWGTLVADPNFKALFLSRKVCDRRGEEQKRLRNRQVDMGQVQYSRGFLDALDYLQELPESVLKTQGKIAQEEAIRESDEEAVGQWSTRFSLKRRLQRRESRSAHK